MTPGGGVPGGMVHMNAASRPFVPGGAAPLYKQEVPVTPHHSAPPPTNGFSRSPLAGHALAHGLNPGSVQLTGLPAFLATPPIMTNPPYNSAYPAGPPSPISPGASVPPSPFAMSHPPNALGIPRQGPPMGANMNARRGRGPQPVTPLKSSGHNSTPSISMNPAAFAANLAALKAKKKVVVSIPNEKPLPDDSALISQHDCQSLNSSPDFNRDDQEPSPSTEDVKLRHALAAAQTRNKWILRQPWTRDLHDQVPCLDVPQDAIITCAVHPEPWPHSLGLPDTIEIYLPGQSAWDEYQEQRYEEQQLEAEAAALEQQQLQPNVVPLLQPKPLLPSELAIFAPDHKIRSFSISTPADPNMVSFKLNRFLQSQHADSAAANDASGAEALKDEPGPFARLNSDLPSRLREAFARRRGESTDISLRPPTSKHGHTMSLGLPSSGGPFGPEVFSALDLIRANSDQGPSQPPSDTHDAEMPLSDSEAMAPRAPFLAEIAEDDAEEEDANAANAGASSKPSGSGNWKDLGRGFGYEVEPNAQASTSNGKARSHARQASRISVSTSRRGGQDSDELLSDGEDLEIRTNPSEDADASDFEEDVGEYGEEHWHARRASAHLSAFGDAHGRHGFGSVSGASDDDSLRDSLTPSDEQFSNPSDEEAAREERMLRRQHRAAERAARQERKARLRARANTDNTLPSSSIGEADLYETGRYDSDGDHADAQRQDRARRRDLDDIVSNPSDEMHSDFNGTETFGHTHRHGRNDDGPRLSQDFRFPPPKPTRSNASQPRSSNGPTMSGTLGRAAGSSMLNPGAKEFTFGGVASASAGTRAVSAPVSNGQDAGAHFRLPSIKTSSFGSSALGEAASHAPHLNVGAPSFTPGAFTFKAPDGVRLELPSATRSAATGTDAGAEDDRTAQRERQGREKRTRYGPIDYASEDEHDAAYGTSPPRPKASAASIEGPLRSFSTLSRQGPPPFLPPNFQQQQQQQQQQRAVSHDSRFTAEAPSFVPTWAKGAAAFGGSASFKRPTLPDWAPAEKKPTPSIRDPSMFTMETGSKAIPIRRPAEDEAEQSATQNRSPQSGIAAQRNATMQATSPAQSSVPKFDGPGAAGEASGQSSNNTLSAPAPWESSRKSESGWQAERARPIHIPTGPHSFQSSVAGSLVSNAEARLGMRWAPHHTPSLSRDSMSVSSAGRRQRRSDRSPQKHRAVKYDDGDDEDDDESLTDFVEEIAERIDKALEGWAGKILDEVTIMGQVRPNPRHLSPAAVEVSLDQDKIVQELSRRVEEAFDTHLANTFQSHSRKMTDASDETQTTIRPPRQRYSSSDDKVASGLADASGEWDFDYVQEILDMKLGELRDQFKTSITQVIERIDARSESLDRGVAQEADHVNGLTVADVQTKLAESVAARVLEPLDSLLRSHVQTALESRSASEGKLEQSVQAKLDENLFLLSEKGAADRSSLQHMLEARVQDLEAAEMSLA
ncbi:hypothetical protein L1887_55783 [Cichorium endivia]|nr:hypothetical protein L1887_55783 [Cichorium endivia]